MLGVEIRLNCSAILFEPHVFGRLVELYDQRSLKVSPPGPVRCDTSLIQSLWAQLLQMIVSR